MRFRILLIGHLNPVFILPFHLAERDLKMRFRCPRLNLLFLHPIRSPLWPEVRRGWAGLTKKQKIFEWNNATATLYLYSNWDCGFPTGGALGRFSTEISRILPWYTQINLHAMNFHLGSGVPMHLIPIKSYLYNLLLNILLSERKDEISQLDFWIFGFSSPYSLKLMGKIILRLK
jgi:hypothetical protein